MLGSAIALLLLVAGMGCARREGWGLVIWSVKGTNAKAGTVVPVFLKSNISKTYVIGMPNDTKTRVEVPFPSLEFFTSRTAAEKRAKDFAPYASLYMTASRDGLPIRDTPKVAGRRVYRLRLGESVKVLKKAEGEAVFTGGNALLGDWYFVQAADGTRGYVFSNTLILYQESETGSAPLIESAPKPSASLLDMVYSKPWRPYYFQVMLDDDTVDPDSFGLQYGLFADAKNSQIRIELPEFSSVFNFGSVSQSGDWLSFEGSKLRIRFENENTLVADWGGTEPILPDEGWAKGIQSARFVHFDTSVPVVLSGENARRDSEIKSFFSRISQIQQNAMSSVNFLSDISGIFSIDLRGTFEWSHIDQLPAGLLPDVLANGQENNIKGAIRFGLHLAPALASTWMGGFSLLIGETPNRQDFVYRFENGKFVISKALQVTLRGTTESLDLKFSPLIFYLVVK